MDNTVRELAFISCCVFNWWSVRCMVMISFYHARQRVFYRLCLSFFLVLTISYKLAAEELIGKGEQLNLPKCLDIAIKKHPQIAAATNNLDVQKGRIGQAKAGYYPQIKWNSGLSRNASPGKLSSYNEYSSSLSLSQKIFDFNRTGTQVDIQTINLESSRADLNDVLLNIILGVKQAYYDLLKAKRARDINAEMVRQFEQHLGQAKGFFEVGVKPKFDVTKADVDLSNARLNLLKAENALRVALVALNNAMGMPDAPPYDIEDDVGYQKNAVDLGESLRKAYLNRPDLQSLILKKEAAQRSVALAGKDYYPVLTGSAGYGWSGQDFPLDSGWNVGASLNFDLFSGFLTKYQVSEAAANLAVLRADEETLRQTIRLEVEQSCANLQDAEKRISTATVAVRQAEENLDLAQGRYATGVGDTLEVTDAVVAQGNARTNLSAALYDYKIAEASLEKAMGNK